VHHRCRGDGRARALRLRWCDRRAGVRGPHRRRPRRGRGPRAPQRLPDSFDRVKIYTRKGDDGTTGLLFGGRVRKDDALPRAYGAVDEAQAFIGLARAETHDAELDALLVRVCHDLYVCMAELATLPENQAKLADRVTSEMVVALEPAIDDAMARF